MKSYLIPKPFINDLMKSPQRNFIILALCAEAIYTLSKLFTYFAAIEEVQISARHIELKTNQVEEQIEKISVELDTIESVLKKELEHKTDSGKNVTHPIIRFSPILKQSNVKRQPSSETNIIENPIGIILRQNNDL